MNNPSDDRGSGLPSPDGTSVPKNAVVGVVNTPDELVQLGDQLKGAGINPEVYCTERAAATIQEAYRSELDVHATRLAQKLFGFESEHTDKHLAEMEKGHLVLVAPAQDDDTKTVIRDAFAENGGHFVNYYGTWTGERLLP